MLEVAGHDIDSVKIINSTGFSSYSKGSQESTTLYETADNGHLDVLGFHVIDWVGFNASDVVKAITETL